MLAEIQDRMERASIAISADYRGLTVAQLTELRRAMRPSGAEVKIVKNKVAPPFRIAEFDIMFGEGISKSGEIIDLGVDFDIIKKAGSWFSYGETKLGQGRDAVKALIKDNPELADELEQKIKVYIKENE